MTVLGPYVPIPPVADTIDKILAGQFNLVASALENSQSAILKLQDRIFLHRCLNALEYRTDVNTMWVDLFVNRDFVSSMTPGLAYSEVEQGVVLSEGGELEGQLLTTIHNQPNNQNVARVLLIVDSYLPEGTSLTCEVTNNDRDYIEVQPEVLTNLYTSGTRLRVRFTLRRTDTAQTPRLNAWALLYYDPRVETKVSMPTVVEPSQFPVEGHYTVYLDTMGRLISLEEPNGITYVEWAPNGRVAYFAEVRGDKVACTIFEYGPIQTPFGTEVRLLGWRTEIHDYTETILDELKAMYGGGQ